MKKQDSLENLQALTEEEIDQANKRSKGLIGVGPNGRPLLDYLLYNAKAAGYGNVVLVIGEQGQLFKEFYGSKDRNNDFHGLTISFAVQHIPKGREKPFGTADALLQAVEQYPELKSGSYTVCNSDNLYSVRALSALRETGAPNAFIAYDRDALAFAEARISRFAIAALDPSGQLLDIVEKPTPDQVQRFRDGEGKVRVSMNAFKFNGQMFHPFLEACPVHQERNEKELPTALLNMVGKYPGTTLGIPLSEHVPDLTAKEDIAEVKAYLKQHYPALIW
jgi:glucose-1-phosphate adenylyltransferase